MALVKINGRLKFFDVDTLEIKKVSNGRWEVTYDRKIASDGEVLNEGRKFIVVGGRESGGRSNEWFCYYPEFYGEDWLPTKSMVESIRLGAVY